MKKLFLVVLLGATLMFTSSAQAYSLSTREAKSVLKSLLRKHGYGVDTTKYWYCNNRTSTRVGCDVYFYDYTDGEIYCGSATVIEYAYRYHAYWNLGDNCTDY